MKSLINPKLLVKTILLNCLASIPLLLFCLLYILPLFERKFFESKQDTTRIAVESVFNLMTEYDQKVQKGEMSLEVAQQAVKDHIRGARYSKVEYFWINDFDAQIVMHPIKPELDGKDGNMIKDPNGVQLFTEFAKVAKSEAGEGYVSYMWAKTKDSAPVDKLSFVRGFGPWKWVIGTGIYIDDIKERINELRSQILLWLGVASLASLMIAVCSGILYGYQLMKPVERTAIELNKSSEETFQINQQLTEFAETLNESVRSTASSLEVTVASLEELNSMTKINADHADLASKTSEQARVFAKQVEQEIQRLNSSFSEIQGNSKRISDILSVIDDLAFQTNLLALNASVEAARAGDHGKGFAVVAQEVRNLSQRSAASAKDIKGLIHASIESIENGAQVAETNAKILADVVTAIYKIADLNLQITNSSQEQTAGLDQISKAMNQIDQASQRSAEIAQRTSDSTDQLLQQVHRVSDLTQKLTETFESKSATQGQRLGVPESIGQSHHAEVPQKELQQRAQESRRAA